MAKDSVSYGAQVFDALPDAPEGGAGRRAVFEGELAAIQGDKSKFGKPVSIVRYRNPEAAKGARANLQKKYGKHAGVAGLEFHVREMPAQDSEPATEKGTTFHLFVIYDPSKIVDGAWDMHQRELEKKKGEAEARKAAKGK